MSQTVGASFAAQTRLNAKSLDFAFVIAGWPTIYTVAKDSYGIPASGPLAAFSSLKAWADLPAAIGEAAKGRPEEGGFTIGEAEVTILDRRAGGFRPVSDLISRESYLRNWESTFAFPADIPAVAGGALTAAATTIQLNEVTGFSAAGGLAYVGLECVKYTGVDSGLRQLTGCTRGHLLTSATRHEGDTRVYNFMPSLYRRKAFLYKGYQNLGLADWAPAFGGAIAGVEKRGLGIAFRVMSTTWHLHNDSRRVALRAHKPTGIGSGVAPTIALQSHMLSDDYSATVDLTNAPSELTSANYTYLADFDDDLQAILTVTP